MKRLILTITLLAAGCERCKDETTVYEAIYSGGFYEAVLSIVQLERDAGAECDERTIRNAFGVAIGTEYTCTVCR